MSTDKELLEAAAKAAGIEYEPRYVGPANVAFQGLLLRKAAYATAGLWWNPLTDDGDALRLAVKLAMSVEISEYEASTYAYAGDVPRAYAMEMWRQDNGAATRRAITRAAAAIGRSMTMSYPAEVVQIVLDVSAFVTRNLSYTMNVSTAKTNAERQRAFRERRASEPEVRGIFAHPDDHQPIKDEAAKISRRRDRAAKKRA